MRRLSLIAIVLFSFGCPESGPSTVADMSSPDAGSNTDDSGAAPDQGSAPDSSVPAQDAVIEFVSVEWGLMGADSTLETTTSTLTPSATGWTGTADVPAGVVGVRLIADGETLLDSSALAVDAAKALQELEHGPAFNPVKGDFAVEVAVDGADYDVSLTRLAEPTWAADSAEVATAVGAWWDDVASTHDDSDDAGAVTVELMDGLRQNGGPLHTEHGVLFIAPAQDGEPAPQIRGSWTNWEASPSTELRRIRPGLWARYIAVPDGEQQYKIVYGDGETWVTDRSNPHIEWDGLNPGTVGDFNSVIHPTAGDPRLVWWPGVESPELGNRRAVYVQLPAGYDVGSEDYPTLYFHDGNESIVRGQFHEVASATASASSATSTVNVFVALPSQDVRMAEYTMGTDGSRGDDYVNFLADTLVPMIDGAFRTRDSRDARGLAGASLGGLISFWGSLQHPDVFGYAAGMSSSFFWGENFMIQQVAERGCQDLDYYLDSGSPNDNYDVTLTMRDTLDNLGCRYTYVLEEGGAHDWAYWNGRVGGVFEDFAAVHGDGT